MTDMSFVVAAATSPTRRGLGTHSRRRLQQQDQQELPEGRRYWDDDGEGLGAGGPPLGVCLESALLLAVSGGHSMEGVCCKKANEPGCKLSCLCQGLAAQVSRALKSFCLPAEARFLGEPRA
eukprot:scaffold14670_cov21-Tisochrysis_lutea.AAC.2